MIGEGGSNIRKRRSSASFSSFGIGLLGLALLLPGPSRLEGQERGVERAGDVLHIVLPAVAFGGTVVLHDSEGITQFVKSFLTNLAATGTLKRIISRERPDGSDDNSLPSGHTSAAFQGASFIHLRYGRKAGIPAYAGATFVAFSRVYADRHYVSDVMAGAALGTLSSLLFTDAFERVDLHPAIGEGTFGVDVRIVLGPSLGPN